MQRECPQFRSFHWLPTKEKNQQINVERSLFQIRSLRRLVSALAISAAHVSIFYGNVALDNLQWRTKDKNCWPYYECSSNCWKANSANNNIWVYNKNSRWRCLTKPKCFLYSARGVLSISLPSGCTKVMLNLTRAEGMQIRGDVKDTDIVGRIYVKTYFWKANINCTLISTLHTNHLLNYLRWLVCKVEILVQRLH